MIYPTKAEREGGKGVLKQGLPRREPARSTAPDVAISLGTDTTTYLEECESAKNAFQDTPGVVVPHEAPDGPPKPKKKGKK